MIDLKKVTPDQLESELKQLIIRESGKEDEIDIGQWQADTPLFGRTSPIGLDSLDALQISIAVQAAYGVRLQGDRMVRKHMVSIRTLSAFILSGQN